MSEKTCRYFVYVISFFCISFWFGKRHLGEVRIMISDDVTGTSEIQVQNQHSKTSSSKASMSNSNVIIQKRRPYSIAIVVVGEIRHSKTDMEIWDSCARHLLAPLQRNNHIASARGFIFVYKSSLIHQLSTQQQPPAFSGLPL